MSEAFASLAEQKAATIFSSLGCIRTQTFAPHFQTTFSDKDSYTVIHKPDFLHKCPTTGKITFFEFKCHRLNHKQSFRACDAQLRVQYNWRFKHEPLGMSYAEVSQALWNSAGNAGRTDCLNHAWNHSIKKHLITQKALTANNYVVVFAKQPEPEDATYYAKKGLFYITLDKLPTYLN